VANFQSFILLISGFLACSSVLASENWSVNIEEDPISKSNVCLLVSRIYTIDDGQTTTPVQLIYNGKEIIAKTKSDIDMSYPEIGLQIDTHVKHSISRLHKNSIAVFTDVNQAIHQQFIDGHQARLALGFWPTWPQTHTRTIDFSLIGYTKAYSKLKKCQRNGN